MTTGRRPPGDKETWWWKGAIRAKKEAKKKCDAPGRQDERETSIGKQTRRQRKK